MKKKENDRYDKIISNELKKKELAEKYGAHFGKAGELPPEIEKEWLDYVEAFEQQFENAQRITVWEYIEKPNFRKLAELSDQEIAHELEAVFKLLNQYNISLDTLCKVEDRELYRFITEELFVYEMDDMRIPGMTSCFIYEEFHPNAGLDIEQAIDYFFRMTMKKMQNIGGEGYDMLYIDLDAYRDSENKIIDKQRVVKSLNNFLDTFDSFEIVSYNEKTSDINKEKNDALISFSIHYVGLDNNSGTKCDFQGDGCFKLKPSEYGGWSIYHIDLPGLTIA